MLSYDRYLAILAESDAAVRQGADAAFVKLLEKIRAGAKPRAALGMMSGGPVAMKVAAL